jgi:succinate dehydrogenase / fumarate reductase cytochrome b subunit
MTSIAASAPARARSRPGFLTTTVGRKLVMAVTGTILVGFVCVHMLGNLQVYLGPEAMNHYAEFLRTVLHGAGIWIFRAVLLTSVALHVWAALTLTLEARAARPVGYREWQATDSTLSSRTMVWSGLMLVAFIVYHLLHLTLGTVHPDFVPGDAYHNFVAGFRVPVVAAAYVVANVLLGLHLFHGTWSLFRTLGVSHPRYVLLARRFASAVAVVVTLGNLSFPVAVLTGVVR